MELEEVPDEFRDVADHLSGSVHDDLFREQLWVEEEIDLVFRQQAVNLAKRDELIELQKQLIEKVRMEQQKAVADKQKAVAEKQSVQVNFAKFLLQSGRSITAVAQETGLPEEVIRGR